MPTKPFALVALIILTPVLVLTFFVLRSLSLEEEAFKVEQQRASANRINTAKTLISARLQSLGADPLSRAWATYVTAGHTALTRLSRKRVFSYAFIYENGARGHIATSLQHQYDRLRIVLDKVEKMVPLLNDDVTTRLKLVPIFGDFMLLRCERKTDNSDICIAVLGSDIQSDLRAALSLVSESTGLKHVGLVADNGAVVRAIQDERLGDKAHSLDGLLQSWRLRADNSVTAASEPRHKVPIYLGAFVLIIGWLVAAWLFHRSAVQREKNSEARASIIALLAHELRTPLTNLNLHVDLLKRKATNAHDVARYSRVLAEEIERLSNLAENAISVSKGTMAQPKLEEVAPDDSVREILVRFEPSMKQAGCRVTFLPGVGDVLAIDKTSWERCIVNLIDNVRKYAPGSEVNVSTSLSGYMLTLNVLDNGPGICEELVGRIFEPLERGDADHRSGFGLGLAAVRAMALQNGGDCEVENTNRGTRFTVTMNVGFVDQPDGEDKP